MLLSATEISATSLKILKRCFWMRRRLTLTAVKREFHYLSDDADGGSATSDLQKVVSQCTHRHNSAGSGKRRKRTAKMCKKRKTAAVISTLSKIARHIIRNLTHAVYDNLEIGAILKLLC
jgi:hypothetical protein